MRDPFFLIDQCADYKLESQAFYIWYPHHNEPIVVSMIYHVTE